MTATLAGLPSNMRGKEALEEGIWRQMLKGYSETEGQEQEPRCRGDTWLPDQRQTDRHKTGGCVMQRYHYRHTYTANSLTNHERCSTKQSTYSETENVVQPE